MSWSREDPARQCDSGKVTVRNTLDRSGFPFSAKPATTDTPSAAPLAHRLAARHWRPGQLLRPRQSLRLARFLDRRLRHLRCRLRLSLECLQLDLRPVPVAYRRGARQARRPPRGAYRDVPLERGLLCCIRRAQSERILWRALPARRRRVADLSRQRQGNRPVVPRAGAQPGHLAQRRCGQVCLGHRSSRDRHRSHPRRMALELCLHRRCQFRLLSLLLARLSRSGRGSGTNRNRAPAH